jgi:hypothetical protein
MWSKELSLCLALTVLTRCLFSIPFYDQSCRYIILPKSQLCPQRVQIQVLQLLSPVSDQCSLKNLEADFMVDLYILHEFPDPGSQRCITELRDG